MDVVVVGSGGAALNAALHAATRGAKVTVLERAAVFGGTTALSGAAQWVPLNSLGKKEFGLQDSPEDVLCYLDAVTLGLVARSTLEAFVREAPRYVDFLMANTTLDVVAQASADDYQTKPGAKGPGRTVSIGLYDTALLGEYQRLLRLPPWPGGTGPTTSNEEREGVTTRRLFDLATERRAKGIAARGCALVAGLMEACLKHGVELVHSARAIELVHKNGRIAGVRAQRDGRVEIYEARLGVVLACGGFEWDRRLWDGMVGVPLDGPLSPPFAEGDGLRMAMAAGARLGNMGQVWWYPGMAIPGETYDGKPRMRSGVMRNRPGSITVNGRGRRFFNENMGYNDAGRPLTYFDPHSYTFANHPAFSIADRATIEAAPVLQRDLTTPADPSWLIEAPTLRELAGKIGVDPLGLEEQVREWNANCEKGVDLQFHRGELGYGSGRGSFRLKAGGWEAGSGDANAHLKPIGDGPFYAVQMRSSCFGTKGGPVIDGEARVVDFDNKPVPGLFAAGNTTAGIFGHAYPGAGGTLGAAVVMGWIAGRTATT